MAQEDISQNEINIVLPSGDIMTVPFYIADVLRRLNDAGFEAYAVGGCVRDSMLGILPNDYDVCTSAEALDIKAVFKDFRTVDTGIKHGTITVISQGKPVEVTTFRVDGEYEDHRRPDSVIFTKNITEDLARRDFTVNAMAVGLNGEFYQSGDGVGDLRARQIKCVGQPEKRFEEDALRILRAMRFAARFGFKIESKTYRAMLKKKSLLRFISKERIFSELTGLLTVSSGENLSKVLDKCREIIAVIIPEFIPSFDCDQRSKHHIYTVWKHTLKAIEDSGTFSDAELRWAIFLHDICKPYFMVIDIDGRGHFPRHDYYGAKFGAEILNRLKAPNEFTENVSCLIRRHDLRLSPSRKNAAKILRLCGPDRALKLFYMMKCDIMAQSSFQREEKLHGVFRLKFETGKYVTENGCYNLKNLKINGNDLINMGFKAGPVIKEILDSSLDAVIGGEVDNNYESLKKYVTGKFVLGV